MIYELRFMICAKRTQFGAARLASGGELRKTKPNLSRMGHLGDASGGPLVRNEANCRPSRRRLGPAHARTLAIPGPLDRGPPDGYKRADETQ